MVEFKYVSPFKHLVMKDEYTIDDVIVTMNSLVSKGDVLLLNGMSGRSGWELLSELRDKQRTYVERSGDASFNFPVIVTNTLKMRFLGEEEKVVGIDLVQFRNREMVYWWEIGTIGKNAIVSRRVAVKGARWRMYDIGSGRVVRVIVACESEGYGELLDAVKHADYVEVRGMLVDPSMNKDVQSTWLVAADVVPKRDDHATAGEILKLLRSWEDVAPAIDVRTGNLLFPWYVVLSMMFATMFYKEDVPALNVIFMGVAASGKTTALKIQAVDFMGGTFEAATSSSGKMWLVSHKDGTPSKVFTESKVMLVDEFFKAVSTQRGSFHSYAMELNSFLQKHMQVLEKREIESSSGSGTLRGRMKCSFVGTENDDIALQKALMRADSISSGPLRRLQFAYVAMPEAGCGKRFRTKVDAGEVEKHVKALMYARFGRNALRGISALYMFSRKFTMDSSYSAPEHWIEQMMEYLYFGYENGEEWVPKEFAIGMDNAQNERLKKKVSEFIDHHQPALNACWVCAGVVRGWEVHDSMEVFEPCFDLRQQEMAEGVARYLFESKLKVLSPGVEDSIREVSNIERVRFGGM